MESDAGGSGAVSASGCGPTSRRAVAIAWTRGTIVVDSITPIRLADITADLARESGFSSVRDLLETAKHGPGDKVYLIRFHYLPPGAWDVQRAAGEDRERKRRIGGAITVR